MDRINRLRAQWHANRLFAACWLVPAAAFAVSPLTTDDADTIEPGRLQLNAGWQFGRMVSVHSHTIPINPVVGLCSRGELGATFGYQWRDTSDAVPGKADGITDVALATKWRLWQTADAGFKLSGRLDLKLPAASEPRGLGTGQVDVGALFIATRSWGPTCLDWNVGYTATDASRSVFGDDLWFFSQAVRHQLNANWTLIGETYASVPHGREGGSSNFHFRGGLQFTVRENCLISVLIGSAVGRDSPDLTGYLGFTRMF